MSQPRVGQIKKKIPFRPFQNKNLFLITLFQKIQWGMRFFFFFLNPYFRLWKIEKSIPGSRELV